jgi:hypothetical protein
MNDLTILILIAIISGSLFGFIGGVMFLIYDFISEFLEGLS